MVAGVGALLGHDPAAVGPYQLVGRLGVGGMGIVYAGLSVAGERVAVKVVHPELAHDPEFRARFAREIALLEKVRSACMVRLFAADAQATQPWFATEYIAGPTLEERVRTAGPLSGDELYGLASGVAEALVAMHAAGVVHRDLKPANVILSPSGPRVVDLGIARAVDEAGVTRTGVLIGSPSWLSPEHFREDQVGPAADVHGWGLLVAFAATGRLPFGAGRADVLAARVLADQVDLTGLEPGLREVVSRTLAKAPEERPSAADLLPSVTDLWRRRMDPDADAVPEGDADAVTAMIERTWVMPDIDDPEWTSATTEPRAVRRLARFRRWAAPVAIGLCAVLLVSVVSAAGFVPWRVAGTGKATRDGQATSASARTSGPTAEPKVAGNGPAPATSSAGVSAPSGAPLEGKRVAVVSGISAVVPTGWTVDSGLDEVGPFSCLYAPGHHPGDGCMRFGILIEAWYTDNGAPVLDSPDAWTGDVDPSALPAPCFSPNSTNVTGITSQTVDGPELRKLGDRSAMYRQYHVACGPYYSFHPRIWWLPKTRLMMTVVALPDQYRQTVDAIARSFVFN